MWLTWQVWLVVVACGAFLLVLLGFLAYLANDEWGHLLPWNKSSGDPAWPEDLEAEYLAPTARMATGIEPVYDAQVVLPRTPVPYLYLASDAIASLYRQRVDLPQSVEVDERLSGELAGELTAGSSALKMTAGSRVGSSTGTKATYADMAPERKLQEVVETLVDEGAVMWFNVDHDGSEAAAYSVERLVRDADNEHNIKIGDSIRDVLRTSAISQAARGAIDELKCLAERYVVAEGSALVVEDESGQLKLRMVSPLSKRLRRISRKRAESGDMVTEKRFDSISLTVPLEPAGLGDYAKGRLTVGTKMRVRVFGFAHEVREKELESGTDYTVELEALSVQGAGS